MRKGFMILATIAVALSMAGPAAAQVRGRGRLQGVVVDKATGQAIAGANVTVAIADGSTKPIIVNTDKGGHWSALGLTSGAWNIDIVAPGYQTSRGSANVSEMQQLPMIKTEMTPEVKQEPEPEAPTGPLVPQEAAAAIEEGQSLLKIKAGDQITVDGAPHTVTKEEAADDMKKAVADFEKALPQIPDQPELKDIRLQLMQVMAQAYYRAGDLKSAIAMMEKTTAADSSNHGAAILLANLYLENGQLDEGKAVLDKLPPTAITDPTAYINLGILFLNKKNATEAASYFTKAIDMDPKAGDGYYYRGLAEVQLKKNSEARADFEKVLALSPDAPEAQDAKTMLDALSRAAAKKK